MTDIWSFLGRRTFSSSTGLRLTILPTAATTKSRKLFNKILISYSTEYLALILCSLDDINSSQTGSVRCDRKNTFHLVHLRIVLSVSLASFGSRNRPCNQDFLVIRVCGFLTDLKNHQANLLLFTTPFLVSSVCSFFGSHYSETLAVIWTDCLGNSSLGLLDSRFLGTLLENFYCMIASEYFGRISFLSQWDVLWNLLRGGC